MGDLRCTVYVCCFCWDLWWTHGAPAVNPVGDLWGLVGDLWGPVGDLRATCGQPVGDLWAGVWHDVCEMCGGRAGELQVTCG